MRAHAESINLTLGKELDEIEAKEILSKAAGVSIIDDRENNKFPTPLDASDQDDVYVGRIRPGHLSARQDWPRDFCVRRSDQERCCAQRCPDR